MDMDEETGLYGLSLEWKKLEESWGNPIVQSVGINQEQMSENGEEEVDFDYRAVREKLSKMFPNVGGLAQSAEFGGNDVWLLKGNYPLTEPGQTATMLFAGDDTYRGRADDYNIFTRTVDQNNEYDDNEIASGTIEKLLPIASKIKGDVAPVVPSEPIKEVEAPTQDPNEETFPSDSDEAIARRVHDETPSKEPIEEVIQLSGPTGTELMHYAQKTGVTTWTDGFRQESKGPFLPRLVEDEILEHVGNVYEIPFTVTIEHDKYHPLDFNNKYNVYIRYQELEPRPIDPHEFGNRDMGA